VSQVDNAVTKRDRDGMGPGNGAELANGRADMLVDGPLGDMKNFTDLPGRFTSRYPSKDLNLPCR
jgi:hypothetical protein